MKCEIINHRNCEDEVGGIELRGTTRDGGSISLTRTYSNMLFPTSIPPDRMSFNSLNHAKKVALKMLETIEELE